MIYVQDTEDVVTQKQADKFKRDHVVVSLRDLKRIAALAKKYGIYAELKKLDIRTRELV